MIFGGNGADTFRLNSRLADVQSYDTIEDFDRAEDDRFDLLDIDPSRVTLRAEGANAQILVDGDLEFLVLSASVSDASASIVYSDL